MSSLKLNLNIVQGVNTLQSPLPKDNILAYLRSCRDNLLDTDVTIYCNDGTVTAHKLVLGSISQMLFVEFSINFQDESVSLILPDCSSQLITQYLDAIYSCSSVKSFDSLNEMFGYEMAVRFLPNLLNYNEAKLQEDVTEKENLNDSMKDEMNEEDDQENNGVTEHRKPVIIPFYKKPANDGVNKVISFVKKSQSSPGKTHRKSSKVWFHYHEDPTDSRNRICRHCGFVIFCPDKSTWTMHSHIISKHKEKIFSFSEGIILQNFEDEEIKKSKPPLKVEKTSEVMDDSHIDPETGEIVSKLTKKRKKKRSQVWKYFVEDTQDPGLEGKRGAICQICLAVVHCNDSSTSNMLNHLNSVHDVTINHKKESSESSMCSICGQIFNSKASRDRHENLHLEQFKFYCNFCGKGFMEASRKVKHERTHTGEKPHQVESSYICSFVIQRIYNFSVQNVAEDLQKQAS